MAEKRQRKIDKSVNKTLAKKPDFGKQCVINTGDTTMKEKLLSWLLAGSMLGVWLSVALAVYAVMIGNHDAGVASCIIGLVFAVVACMAECLLPRRYDLG